MTIYTRAQDTAYRMLKSKGAPVRFSRASSETHDPITGQVTNGPKEHSGSYGIIEDYGDDKIDDTQIKRGDKELTVAAKGLTFAPELTHKADFNNTQYQIINVKALAPAGIPITYSVQVR